MTLFDAQIMTHSLTTPDRDGSRSRDFSSFWFDNLSPILALLLIVIIWYQRKTKGIASS